MPSSILHVLFTALFVSGTCSMLAAAQATTAPPAPTPSDEFLELFSKTNRFRLGEPGGFKITPDGKHVLFLRSEGPTSFSQELWLFDVEAGKERKLLNAHAILGGKEEKLSAEELARRERTRSSSRGIASFQISKDGKLLLIPLSGKLYAIEFAAALAGDPKPRELNTGEGILDPRLAPDNKHVAFVREGTVFALDLKTNETKRVSPPGEGSVSFGDAEFVAQEEMKRMHGFWWSPDSTRIAYQRTDVAALETFTIADPSDPGKPPQSWRYPRAGKANADVTLWIAPLPEDSNAAPAQPFSRAAIKVRWDYNAFPYLARVDWPKHGPMTILVQNRAQTEQRLLRVDPASGATTTILTENDAAWVNLENEAPKWDAEGKTFLWLSEQGQTDGWEVQIRDRSGGVQRRLQLPTWEVNGLVAASDKEPVAILSVSPKSDPSVVFPVRVDLTDGSVTSMTDTQRDPTVRMTVPDGQYGVEINDTLTAWVALGRARDGTPTRAVFKGDKANPAGGSVGSITSVAADPPFTPKPQWAKSTISGREFHSVVVRPREFDPKKKYPVLNFVYAGPGNNQVNANARAYLQHQFYADQGFIVVSIDGRGTPRRGRDWERVLKKDGVGNFIDVPLQDQCDVLEDLCKQFPEMDRTRIGVYGWSFGGYFSSMATMRRPDIFKCGIAGAPVTDWLDYDTHYTERYLGVPGSSAIDAGYTASNVLSYCKDLKVPLLVIHGTADDNVYFVHALKLTDRLFKDGKPFEFLPLSGQTHMVTKPDIVKEMNRRMIAFFRQHLGGPR
ncbi:MAG TPA: prolyl oligopeptidase family serine peptidase [Phycisphaerales bacterium]